VILSGSYDLPGAALVFEEDGSMRLLLMSSLSESDVTAITLVSDYFQYALSREDWMLEFVDNIVSESALDKIMSRSRPPTRPNLRVIKGGKSDTSGSQ